MSATLPHYYACNWRATFWTRLASALVDAEIVLEITTPVDPINAGSISGDPLHQNRADAGVQPGSLLF
jgi:hypothetical protein